MEALGWLILGLSSLGLLAFVAYPPIVWLLSPRESTTAELDERVRELPTVSVLVAVRNGEDLVQAKIENTLALDYPPDRLQLVLVSDGSTDATAEILERHESSRVVVSVRETHTGKASALNETVELTSGEILVFSDTDARLDPGALRKLIAPFEDADVGGVCGQRVVGDAADELAAAQSGYIGFDSRIKRLESRRGSITSNDGKIYAIRRALFRPIHPAATDDLYSCLSVVAQGRRFVFAPDAVARVRVPSRDPAHELSRRRRIVCRSLRGIFAFRELLNPLRHGRFAIGLLVNKVFRRLLPLSLIGLLLASALLCGAHLGACVLLAAQLSFYLAALSFPLWRRLLGRAPRPVSLAYYFCLGNLGTLLGLVDLLRNRSVTRWEPRRL